MAHVSDDVKEVRRLRLLELLKGQTAAELAEKLGVPDSYVSNIKNKAKSLGDILARRWEKKLGLGKYWFDGEEPSVNHEAKALYHGIALTRSGALLGAEWEKLDVSDRIDMEQEIMARVKKGVLKRRGVKTPSKEAED